MSPLRIEVYNVGLEDWAFAGELEPGERPGSISQNKPDGEREIYLFECEEENEQSVIYRSKGGVDVESPAGRTILSQGFETVAVLRDGQSHEVSIKTDRDESRSVIRFTHQKERE